jgi:hypothetical protein
LPTAAWQPVASSGICGFTSHEQLSVLPWQRTRSHRQVPPEEPEDHALLAQQREAWAPSAAVLHVPFPPSAPKEQVHDSMSVATVHVAWSAGVAPSADASAAPALIAHDET